MHALCSLRLLYTVTFTAILVISARAQIPSDVARIHYHRTNGDYQGWSIYVWTGAANPSPSYNSPYPPNGTDNFGIYFDVALAPGATQLFFIVRNADGSVKNCPSDMVLNLGSQGHEAWLLQGDCAIYTAPPPTNLVGNVKQARASWVSRDTIAWFGAESDRTYLL